MVVLIQLKGNPMTILVVIQRRCQFEEFGKMGEAGD